MVNDTIQTVRILLANQDFRFTMWVGFIALVFTLIAFLVERITKGSNDVQ